IRSRVLSLDEGRVGWSGGPGGSHRVHDAAVPPGDRPLPPLRIRRAVGIRVDAAHLALRAQTEWRQDDPDARVCGQSRAPAHEAHHHIHDVHPIGRLLCPRGWREARCGEDPGESGGRVILAAGLAAIYLVPAIGLRDYVSMGAGKPIATRTATTSCSG